jgi:hypothetical protein
MSAIIESASISVRDYCSVAFGVSLAACILVALGSSRAIVGPLGYWLVWAVVVVVGLFDVRADLSTLRLDKGFRKLSLGFALLFSGFAVSAGFNNDTYTLFQGFKWLCIFAAFVAIYSCARKLAGHHLVVISKVTICTAFVVFGMSKLVFKDWYVWLEDGREGSQFAYPGVLWKTSVFFFGFILVGMVKGRHAFSGIAILMAAVYLLLVDSSRTGFLWSALVFAVLLAKIYTDLSRANKQVFFACGGGIILLSVVFFYLYGDMVGADMAIFKRLSAGDSVRVQLLTDGVEHAKECFVFGCGFGSASSLIMGENVVVHNAYLGSLADLGFIGLSGFTILMLQPFQTYWSVIGRKRYVMEGDNLAWVAMMGVLGYGFSMALHPQSTELSEWGLWIVMVSWMSTLCASRSDRAIDGGSLETCP